MRVWIYSAAMSAVFLASVLGTPALAQTIGSVIELNRDAYGTPPGGQTARLDLGGSVVSDELVQTLAEASTRIRFLDESDLRVGQSSMIVLDRLIYDPDQGTGEFVLGIAVGTMRFISGDLPPEQVLIETPVAMIGIRGTDFVVTVTESGRTAVAVFEGQVIIAPFGGEPVLASPGQTAVVGPTSSEAVVQAGLVVPLDPGLGKIPDESEIADGVVVEGGDGHLARDTAVPVIPTPRPSAIVLPPPPPPPAPAQAHAPPPPPARSFSKSY